MRIRKNANISAFLHTNSNNQTNFCQLNQSPWDIITFPPSSSSSLHHPAKWEKVKNGSNIIYGDRGFFHLQNESVWGTTIRNHRRRIRGHPRRGPTGSRPRRAKKRAVAVTSNRNEFYYYSGFGPSWGKKRGRWETNARLLMHVTIGY
ncbi:hypothetical protein OSB04_008665 [Centaurea solstitialis]|uniref:Uncharacterized protein n=1 Tax=Centaurea solstitialis TaxID=347529 RepID=A0AA38TM83_9ASTR|nr:hypothetical protein OSB04_008665 [Centaurea solstitialis]